MPELPEVETIVRGLSATLVGQTILKAHLTGKPVFDSSPDQFLPWFDHAKVTSITRHGKSIYIRLHHKLKNQIVLWRVHLGMTGQLLWAQKNEPILSHTHLIFDLDHDTHHLRYRDIRRFGGMSVDPSNVIDTRVPDAWNLSRSQMIERLGSIRGMLKNALLGQKVVTGLGNIYVDEALFRAKLHPRKNGARVKAQQWTLLAESIRFVLGRSIKAGGTSFQNYVDVHGGRGGFKSRLAVYGKTNEPCPNCQSPIRRIVVAGRGTHVCLKCQPSPR
jgi:formamidopyrimidine-DNA glycosylase